MGDHQARQRKAVPAVDQDQRPPSPNKRKAARDRTTCWRGLVVSGTVTMTIIALSSLLYLQWAQARRYPWPVPHEFTKEELSKYTGADGGLILLSILGQVYDVTAAPEFYGPQGGYRFFSGKDASRSFVDGCFNDNCFDADKALTGLTKQQIESLQEWKSFYDKEDKYKFVGILKGWKMGELADGE